MLHIGNPYGYQRIVNDMLAVRLVTLSLGTNAQKEEGKKANDIRFGYHTAAMYDNGSKLSGTKNYQSFYLGFFRDNKLIPALHLGTGLEYFQNGYRIDGIKKPERNSLPPRLLNKHIFKRVMASFLHDLDPGLFSPVGAYL